MSRPALRTAGAVALSVIALAGCGGAGNSATTGSGASTMPTGATVRSANCMLWNVLDPTGRRQLVVAMRAFFSQRLDTGAQEHLLSNDRAYQVITSYCRLHFARAFLLYRLYGNAAAFSP